MEYRGIQLDESVKLINTNGEYRKQTKQSLDKLADLLAKNNHALLSEYKGNKEKILISFNCEHEPHWTNAGNYKNGRGNCPKCKHEKLGQKNFEQGKENFLSFVKSRGHNLLSEYKGNKEKVLIDFNCEHEPHWVTAGNYNSGCSCPYCSRVKGKEIIKIAKTEKGTIEYRGIQLDESVKLYKNNSEYNLTVKRSLDNLVNLLMEKNHILKSNFINVRAKVLIDFNCGHEPHWVEPNGYKNGFGCPKCGQMQAIKKISKKSEKELSLLIESNGHRLLTPYVKNDEKVLIDFNCSHEPKWMRPNTYKNGIRCRECGYITISEEKIRKSKKEFLSLIKSNGHKLLTPYVKAKEKVLIDFNCGHEPHLIAPAQYNFGIGCPKCGHITASEKKFRRNKEEFPLIVESNGHKLLSEFEGIQKKILIDFNCGHEPHWVQAYSYREGGNCPKCSGKCPIQAKENFIELVKSKGHNLLTPYVKAIKKVLIDFNCGHEPHWIQPNNYSTGHRCPICKESRGEKIIREWLDQNNIEYQREYKLPNKNWRYDFYIPSENLIVEVQGIQHFKFVEHFHKTREEFYKRANGYNEKWAYACNTSGYNFVEVDYREGKPELALERFLEEFNELQAK